MNYYDFIVPLLAIYGSCIIGIFVAISALNAVDKPKPKQPNAEGAEAEVVPEAPRRESYHQPSPSESGSESSEEKVHRTRKATTVKLENEMDFFKELGRFFKRDNRMIFSLVVVMLLLAAVAAYFTLDIIFVLGLAIGMLDFAFSFWFSRKIFIKATLKLDFASNATKVCYRDWTVILRFIFSTFIATISSTVASVYTLLVLWHYRLGPYMAELEQTGDLHGMTFLRTRSDAFIVIMAFYFIGKNIFHIFNNLWESFHMNNKVFELLSVDTLSRKSLEFYSQGYFYNIMVRVHRQTIIFSEVLVVLTIGMFQIRESLSPFFVYFYTLLLWFIMVFYLTTIWMFNFKNSMEATRMTVILKLGFLYYFIMQFMFIYYRYFIAGKVLVYEPMGYTTESTLLYAYSLMMVLFLVQKLMSYLFDPREIKKLKALNQDSSQFEFFLNDKVMTKLTVALLATYAVYLVLGLLGIFFLFFYFSIQRLFYRIKKYILVFDLYLRIVLWATRVAPIHSFTFNKLLELVDKTYVQNFFLLLFIVPLICVSKRSSPIPNSAHQSYVAYLFVSLLSFMVSTVLLILYTKLIVEHYSEGLETRAKQVASGDTRAQIRAERGHKLTRDKLFLIVSALILTIVFVCLFIRFGSFYFMLAIIIGQSIHLVQLIYTNKIRVKKFLNVRTSRLGDDAFIHKINSELAESTSYSKSVCELSFASIMIEFNKIMLITFFFLNNLA